MLYHQNHADSEHTRAHHRSAAPAAAQSTTMATTLAAADATGNWNATVTTEQGAIPTQIKLKKDADKLVGTISSQMGETPIQAEVKGKDVSIWFNFQGQNGPMAIELNGTVDGDSAKGSMLVGGQVGGEWVASRSKEGKDSKDPAKVSKDPAPAPSTPSKDPSTPSLTGTYNVTVELPNMTANPTVELKQDGEKLTGEYMSAQYGKFPVDRHDQGCDVNFTFAMNVEGNGLNVTYTGVVDKDGGIKGFVDYGDMMSGDLRRGEEEVDSVLRVRCGLAESETHQTSRILKSPNSPVAPDCVWSAPGGAYFSICVVIFWSSSGARGPQQCGARRWKTISPISPGCRSWQNSFRFSTASFR